MLRSIVCSQLVVRYLVAVEMRCEYVRALYLRVEKRRTINAFVCRLLSTLRIPCLGGMYYIWWRAPVRVPRPRVNSDMMSIWYSERFPREYKSYIQLFFSSSRYILYDTWNFLDFTSIIFVVVAFVFRVRGARDSASSAAASDDFFLAQFFLAASTPFFFARLLLLSQVDGILGPMIQVCFK